MLNEFKIYFIYSEKEPKSNIIKIESNEQNIKIEPITSGIISSGEILNCLYTLYCLNVSNKNNINSTTLKIIDNQGEIYIASINIKDQELLRFQVIFQSYDNKIDNALGQIILPFQVQYTIFKNNIKNDDKLLCSLYSKRLKSLLDNNKKNDYEIIFNFFLELYHQYNSFNKLKTIIIAFFEKLNYKNINNLHQNHELNVPQYDINIFEKYDMIRKDLISITNNKEKINENIDVFLGYYYLFYKPKLFILYINIPNENDKIHLHLISNRFFFNNFSLDILNFELMNEAENLQQVISLMSLLPSMIDCFKLLSEQAFYEKVSLLTQIENKELDIMEISKPKKTDDIELLSQNYNLMHQNILREYNPLIVIKENFYIEYCKLFLKEDVNKIKIIINIFKNNDKNNNYKSKLEQQLNKYYLDTGIYLINDNRLINRDFIEFIKNIPNFNVISNIQNGIVLKEEDSNFVNAFLNNELGDFDFKKYLGNNYYKFIKNIFDKFIIPKDLLVIRKWEINDNASEEVIKIFLDAIKRIWLNDPKNHMWGLEDLIANEFGKASLIIDDYFKVIKEIENKIPVDIILEIYSRLLYRKYRLSYEFKQYIIQYIYKNAQKEGPLSLWYNLNTYDDEEDKFNYLEEHLKDEYAVKVEDFIHYPSKIEDRLLLFTNLYNGHLLNDSIEETNYYKNSLQSKDNLENLKIKDIMIMYKNLEDFPNLLIFFLKQPFQEDYYIIVESLLFDFSDKCGLAQSHYESLKTVLNFWNRFFPNEKMNERTNLKIYINKYENSPLKQYNSLLNETQFFLEYLYEAKEGEKLFESIFFMEIYERSKNNYDKSQERRRYSYCLQKFNELKILGKMPNAYLLDMIIKDILVSAVYKNIDKLNDELNFIKDYFHFDSKNNEYNNYNVNLIKRTLLSLVKKYQDEHGSYKIKIDDNFDYDVELEKQINNNLNNINNKEDDEDEDDDDDDDEFSLFEHNKIKKKKKNINVNKIIDNNNQISEQQKMKLINDFYSLSKIYFSKSKIIILKKSEMNIGKELEEKKDIYKAFINFFLTIFNANFDFSILSSNEFLEKIISLSNKVYINGVNLGLFDNIEKSTYKKELIIISQFNDVIEKYTIERKINKGIFFNLLAKFKDCYNNRDKKGAEIKETFDFLLTEIKDKIIDKKKLINLFVELLIKERKIIDNDQELLKYILNDGNSNFYYLYKDLIPFLNEIFKSELIPKLNSNGNNDFINFNLGIFNKINEKCENSKIFEEMILFYFETKIMNYFNENYNKEMENEKELFNEQTILRNLKLCLEYLEKEFKKELGNKPNKRISILFCIAFIKCFLNKMIKYLYSYYQYMDNIKPIFNNTIKGANNTFRTSFKLYVLKLLFDNAGNYYNYVNLELKNLYQIDYLEDQDIIRLMNEKEIDSFFKEYGFDYIIISNNKNFNLMINELIEIKKYNINNEVNDSQLINVINNNYEIDTFYCALLNIHFSFFYNDKYIKSNECEILNKWLIDKINNKEFSLLNKYEMIKDILLFFIKKSDKNLMNNNILPYDKLLCLLLSARFVLSTITFINNGLYYQLMTNIKTVISHKLKYFDYYLKDYNNYNDENDQRFISYLTYKIINYIILSHLYFGNVLEKMSLDDINKLLSLEKKENINNDYILDLLFGEFNFINKILKLFGIKNIIIFMNNIFDKLSSKIINTKCNNEDSCIKTEETDIDIYINDIISDFKKYVEEYEELKSKIDIMKDENKNLSIYHKVLFEKNEFYNNKSQNPDKICPFMSYLTSTNFCSFDDFKEQFLYTNNEIYNYPLIYCLIKKNDIIELIKSIPKINIFINNVYNELVLKISTDDINKKLEDILSKKTLENIDIFNEGLEEILNIFNWKNIKLINKESTISEVINIKNNNINKLYDEIIKKYNKFISSMKIYNNDIENIDSIIIQNIFENDYINFIKMNNINDIILIEDRLNEMIQLYSKRNRIINNNLINVYDGGKIIYDYELIENKLEKEFIFGKKKFEQEQKLFIFSNEVFNIERNNIFLEINQKYPQTEIKEDELAKIEEYLKPLKKEDLIKIYYNLQYIIINAQNTNYDYNEKRLDYIVKIIEKTNYFMNDSFYNLLQNYDDILSLDNLKFLYEKIELKVFEYLTEDITINNKENEISKDNIAKIEEILNNKDLVINKEIFINVIKKYILRYCLGNNDNKNNILNNFKNIDDIFNRYDIWEEKIIKNKKFKDNWNKLKNINNEDNLILKYLLNILFKKKEEVEEKKKEDINKKNKNNKNEKGQNYIEEHEEHEEHEKHEEHEENEDSEDVDDNNKPSQPKLRLGFIPNKMNKQQYNEEQENENGDEQENNDV